MKYDSASGSLKNIAVPGSPYEALMDTPGNAIGVAACDLDGDGREEIYFLNTNQVISRSYHGCIFGIFILSDPKRLKSEESL